MARLKPARAPRSDAVANRERILEAAREVFARRGLAAEVREIAEQAGVGIGTLYRHFEGREALLAALLQETKQALLQRLQAAVEREAPQDALRAIVLAGADVCEQFGTLAESVLAGRLSHLHGGHAEFTALLTNLLQRGVQEGAFRADLDVAVAVTALESIFTSGSLTALARLRSYAGAADATADFFLAAMVSRNPEGAPKPL